MKNAITPELITALKNGDHQAFETVFIAFFSKVKVFIAQLIKSEDEAEELTQELFVRLWENRTSLDISRSFSSYIYIMARNVAFNYIKHQNVKENYTLQYIPLEEKETPDNIIYAKELALIIEMAVSKMPVQRQSIYKLSRNQGLTNEEIATQLQVSKKTVENQLSLAIKELRKLIRVFLLFFV